MLKSISKIFEYGSLFKLDQFFPENDIFLSVLIHNANPQTVFFIAFFLLIFVSFNKLQLFNTCFASTYISNPRCI